MEDKAKLSFRTTQLLEWGPTRMLLAGLRGAEAP